jgi:hypothetical protein
MLRAELDHRRSPDPTGAGAPLAMPSQPDRPPAPSRIPAVPWDLIRWDLVVAAGVLAIAASTAVIWLPRVFAASAKTALELTGAASTAASEAATTAAVTSPVKAATYAMARGARRQTTPTTSGPAPAAEPAPTGGGVLAAFS